RIGAVAHFGGHPPFLYHRADGDDAAKREIATIAARYEFDGRPMAGGTILTLTRLWSRRSSTLIGAISIAVSTVMLAPLIVSTLASLKTTEEAAEVPPSYFPHILSFASYERLINYQAGLLTYVMNSG